MVSTAGNDPHEPTFSSLHAESDARAGTDHEIESLIADAERLADRLLAVANPAVARLGRRLGAAVSETRLGLANGSARIERQARRAAHVADQYAHQQPWQVVGAVALLAVAIGFAVARR
jgi:ElaB protein